MIALIAVALAVSPLARAQDGVAVMGQPEQHKGQVAQMRLRLLYPAAVKEPRVKPGDGPSGELAAFLEETRPVLKNTDGLVRYLRAGLKEPISIDGSRDQWRRAWTRLDAEEARLKELIARGEALQGGPIPAQKRWSPSKDGYVALEDKPEFPSEEGRRLHRAVVLQQYLRNQREYLVRKSAEKAGERARGLLDHPLP